MASAPPYFFIAVPNDGSKQLTLQKLRSKIAAQPSNNFAEVFSLNIPDLKVGTLDTLMILSDELAKADTSVEAVVGKMVENIKALLSSTQNNIIGDTGDQLKSALTVNDRPVDAFIKSFQWNSIKYRADRPVKDLMDSMMQEVNTIDQTVRTKMASFTTAKNSLVAIERKQAGNLSVKNLDEVVRSEHFVPGDSEYLETILVAVPRSAIKDFLMKYETLTQMVVPRSANKIAEDEDYTLFSVVTFKRVSEEFKHKLRDEKFVPREFVYSEEKIVAAKQAQKELQQSSKDQWAMLIRVCRTNFGEIFQTWLHIKALRVFVESILRYGLPPDFQGMTVRPKPRYERKVRDLMAQLYAKLGSSLAKGNKNEPMEDIQGVMYDKEYLPFVCFELQWDY